MLSSYFKLAENGTTVRTEILAGITTFLTMAYITFVNPAILSDAGMDFGAVFVATCVAAAIGTAIMGLYANYPIALAPGMGLNAFFAYGVVLGMGHSWQVALGAVFLSGILFIILSVLPVREWIINAIPRGLKMAISAGIGLFLAIIALKNAGVVVDHPATLITLGDPTSWPVILAFLGFFVIVALDHRKVPGAVIIGILAVTAAGVALGVSEWKGLASLPPDPLPTFLQLDLGGALQLGLITIVFTFLFVDLFDTAGTLVGLAHRAGLLDQQGRLPRLGKALIADSTATAAGALLGTSTTTSYIESAAGINAGGRTGLTAVTVAVLVPARPVLLAAGPDRAALRDRAGTPLRRLPDDPRPGRDRLGGRDRIGARRGHRDRHAVDLFHRQRHGHRLHHLRRGQGHERQGRRVPAGGFRDRTALRAQVFPALMPYAGNTVG